MQKSASARRANHAATAGDRVRLSNLVATSRVAGSQTSVKRTAATAGGPPWNDQRAGSSVAHTARVSAVDRRDLRRADVEAPEGGDVRDPEATGGPHRIVGGWRGSRSVRSAATDSSRVVVAAEAVSNVAGAGEAWSPLR